MTLVEANLTAVQGDARVAEAERLAEVIDGSRDETLEAAVAHAARLARPGDVVLLSPACASYDQFANFEERGDAFRKLVVYNFGPGCR